MTRRTPMFWHEDVRCTSLGGDPDVYFAGVRRLPRKRGSDKLGNKWRPNMTRAPETHYHKAIGHKGYEPCNGKLVQRNAAKQEMQGAPSKQWAQASQETEAKDAQQE